MTERAKQFIEEFFRVLLTAIITFIIIYGLLLCGAKSNAQTVTNRVFNYPYAVSNHPTFLAGAITNGNITNFFFNVAGATYTNSINMHGIDRLNLYKTTNVFGSGNSTNETVWFVTMPIVLTNAIQGYKPVRLLIMNGLIVGITNFY